MLMWIIRTFYWLIYLLGHQSLLCLSSSSLLSLIAFPIFRMVGYLPRKILQHLPGISWSPRIVGDRKRGRDQSSYLMPKDEHKFPHRGESISFPPIFPLHCCAQKLGLFCNKRKKEGRKEGKRSLPAPEPQIPPPPSHPFASTHLYCLYYLGRSN